VCGGLPWMQRKLTAILSADMAGYSGLMEADEPGTLSRLMRNRTTIFEPQVKSHGGRVFKFVGDGVLAEFPSVVEASLVHSPSRMKRRGAKPTKPKTSAFATASASIWAISSSTATTSMATG